MDKLVIGVLAHVDAGKTTLLEALLYQGGCLKKLGRVDHQDAFLDTHTLERERGITIFSKQAVLPFPQVELTLLDTPGHVDFSSEMERTLQVLDYAVLVISGSDGVQGHTQTLWNLLKRYQVPTFLFINKTDLDGVDPSAVMDELKQRLDPNCIDFRDVFQEEFLEAVAVCDEAVMDSYLENNTITQEEISSLVQQRKLFPCYFGSALKLDGIESFVHGLLQYTKPVAYPDEFGAKVYKIARDPQGNRLTYLKITGGGLKVKTILHGTGMDGGVWEEKVDQIRIYSGTRYQAVEQATAGTVCAVTGLKHTFPGEGLGFEPSSCHAVLEPVLTYQVILPEGCDPHTTLLKLKQLEEEDPQLHLIWNGRLREIHVQLMGEVQLEILKQLILDRFQLEVSFGVGNIVYRETITQPVEGVGHFEPLRHYAEVHLLLEPGKPGSGVQFTTCCSEDVLDRNWQNLIVSQLQETEHIGVLTGSPITDMKITLLTGRAHLKHTEGGDFRQAAYRALRQGLKSTTSILLEPWYQFQLELPSEYVGRAMSDLQRMSGVFELPQTQGDTTILTGKAPVATMRDYSIEVTSYTKGHGRLFCSFLGYEPCHNQEEIIQQIGYDSERDIEHPADSVFCSHGAGFTVKWDQVREYMHVESGWKQPDPEEPKETTKSSSSPLPSREMDQELQAIFEKTYGPIKQRNILPRDVAREELELQKSTQVYKGPEYLLVDGYNIIFASEELKKIAQDNLESARIRLMEILSNYQGFRNTNVILVFDAYKVKGNPGEVIRYHNISVVYTKEAETADAYIEKTTYQLAKDYQVKVATSDYAEQLIILGHGALRIPASSFLKEIELANQQIAEMVEKNNWSGKSLNVGAAFSKAQQSPQ